jgi:hypothetical protein
MGSNSSPRNHTVLRPGDGVKAGVSGKVIVTLTRPDGKQLTDATDFEVLPVPEEKSKKAKGQVPPFEIIPITLTTTHRVGNRLAGSAT